MKISTLTTIFCTTLLTSTAFAQVWHATQTWNEEYEQQYSSWVQSADVHEELFHSPSSKYYGIKVDCADVTYALRAVFAYENELPYQVKNPMYRPGKPQYYTNESSHSSWDNLSDDDKRVVKFVNMLGGFLGTETLSAYDSYPILIKSIRPGDFFLYKIQKDSEFVRHTYNIKGITNVGLFNLIYSTQERAKNNKPMALIKDQKLSHMPTKMNWGFKRFMPIAFFSGDVKQAPNYNLEQYVLAQSPGMTEKKFFTYVQDTLKKSDETMNQQVTRMLKDLCSKTQERIGVVQGAITFQNQTNNACMDYTNFDTFSTPNRDQELKNSFGQLLELASDIKNKQLENEIDANVLTTLNLAVSRSLSPEEKQTLIAYCPINYDVRFPVLDLNTFFTSLQNNQVSSHPNDDIKRRWGVPSDKPKTKCKAYY